MPKRKIPELASDVPQRRAGGVAPATTPDDDWSKLSQREKFIRTAREVGADETGETLDETLRAIGRARKRGAERRRSGRSRLTIPTRYRVRRAEPAMCRPRSPRRLSWPGGRRN